MGDGEIRLQEFSSTEEMRGHFLKPHPTLGSLYISLRFELVAPCVCLPHQALEMPHPFTPVLVLY